ncbi:HIRAN domain-containing protein [Pseudorhodoplanes sp.]|uniref:HIRAN domain-containing protein n=1 Tax=Pseudorhodoplanes sp. TaxID=1934341 RepID=UPI003919C55C
MANALYVAWQDQTSRTWHTVARLRRVKDEYEFVFTRGAERLRNVPSELFRMDVRKRYRSNELIPLFRNRLLSSSRTDYHKISNWLNLSGEEDEFGTLMKFGLIPGTDSILIYPEPTLVNNNYALEFFVHGLRHMHRDAINLCRLMNPGERLLPLLDVQNPFDPNAVALRCPENTIIIGYVPTFYAADLRDLLSRPTVARNARIVIVKNNTDAPEQLRLLCKIEAVAPAGFRALSSEDHQPLFDEAA